jgi:hypothetical protein
MQAVTRERRSALADAHCSLSKQYAALARYHRTRGRKWRAQRLTNRAKLYAREAVLFGASDRDLGSDEGPMALVGASVRPRLSGLLNGAAALPLAEPESPNSDAFGGGAGVTLGGKKHRAAQQGVEADEAR